MISLDQWRAVIGCFWSRGHKSRSQVTKIVITPGNARLGMRILLFYSLALLPSFTEITSTNQKRDIDAAGISPSNDVEPKRIDQRSSPSDVLSQLDSTSLLLHGPDPPVTASLVTTANEQHPPYTPGRPTVYLAMDSGEAVIKPPSRRSLALDGISTTPALTDS